MIIKNAETSQITNAQKGITSPAPSRSGTTGNGNLWVVIAGDTGMAEFWVRARGGRWSRATNRLGLPLGAFRIDEDDNAHYTYVSGSRLYYHRGTPNAERTQWNWSTAQTVYNASGLSQPDLVVHKEGTGWVAHIVASRVTSSTTTVTTETQVEVPVTNAVEVYVTEYEWRALTTETMTWDPTPEYPADETWRGSHDHTVTRWSLSNTTSPFSGTIDASHSHTLSGFTGARFHNHTVGDWQDGSLTGRTRRVYSHTDYQTTTETRTQVETRQITNYSSRAIHVRVDVDNTGEVTATAPVTVSPTYATSRPTHPSIAFRHTGDEKTVNTAPDLFMAWSAGRSGAAYGIRFKKATYATGAWTWGAEQAIDDGYVLNSDNWLDCVFDGDRVIIGGLWRRGSNNQLVLKERDVADTITTTLHESPTYPLSGAGRKYMRGALSYDTLGNIYAIGVQDNAPLSNSSSPVYLVWDRAAGALDESDVRVGIASSNKNTSQIVVKRGDSHAAIDWFHGLTSTPFSIFHERFELINKPLRTKLGGTFIKGEIAHREGGQFLRGTIYSKRAGAFNVPV